MFKMKNSLTPQSLQKVDKNTIFHYEKLLQISEKKIYILPHNYPQVTSKKL